MNEVIQEKEPMDIPEQKLIASKAKQWYNEPSTEQYHTIEQDRLLREYCLRECTDMKEAIAFYRGLVNASMLIRRKLAHKWFKKQDRMRKINE